jgi:hypothetical protein
MRSFTFVSILLTTAASAQTATELASVKVMATLAEAPPRITLVWEAEPGASGFSIHRRAVGDTVWGNTLATLPATTSQYADNTVQIGLPYEYKVVREGTADGYGYIRSGIKVPQVEQRGTMLLIVESILADALVPEIEQLRDDLFADGWKVVQHVVDVDDSPVAVREWITAQYQADPERVRAAYLLGRVPVPYSGAINPDGHAEHLGAWPCDAYYADVDGMWTDTMAAVTTGSYVRNHNLPGDGKWDQNDLPSSAELQVGRVDLSRLDALGADEVERTRAYLQKAHAWKIGAMSVPQRATVWDNLTWVETPLAFSGMAGFAPCVGLDSLTTLTVSQVPNFSTYYFATNELFTYQCGSGLTAPGAIEPEYIGTANGLNTNQLQASARGGVFNLSIGSYYGDWDNAENFLRALIGSGNALAHMWSGMPMWPIHELAMGDPVGHCALSTMNNTPADYAPQNGGWQGQPIGRTHVALMGDPSLRMRYIAPPSDLVATNSQWYSSFTWTASPQPVDGYHIYRIDEANDTLIRITPQPVQGTSFTSDQVFESGARYMVRAIALVTTPSGSYYDLSLGATATAEGEPVLDCMGVLGGEAIPGTPCDDGIALTTDEVFDALCVCSSPTIGMPELGRVPFQAWPSPVDDVLVVTTPERQGDIIVRSPAGVVVRREHVQGGRVLVDVRSFAPGVYVMEYTASKSEQPAQQLRIVVQR